MHYHLLGRYRDKYAGQAAVILGNGPSINDYDLSDPFFTENVTFGSNAIGLKFRPSYYFIGDEVAYVRYGDLMYNKRSVPMLGVYVSTRSIANKGDGRDYIRVDYNLKDSCGHPTLGRIYHGRTSGVIMLHIAYQMGFKFVFILGVDGYGVDGPSHFFDGAAGRASSDSVVEENLSRAYQTFVQEGKFLFTLSIRGTFRSIPLWPALRGPSQNNRKTP